MTKKQRQHRVVEISIPSDVPPLDAALCPQKRITTDRVRFTHLDGTYTEFRAKQWKDGTSYIEIYSSDSNPLILQPEASNVVRLYKSGR